MVDFMFGRTFTLSTIPAQPFSSENRSRIVALARKPLRYLHQRISEMISPVFVLPLLVNPVDFGGNDLYGRQGVRIYSSSLVNFSTRSRKHSATDSESTYGEERFLCLTHLFQRPNTDPRYAILFAGLRRSVDQTLGRRSEQRGSGLMYTSVRVFKSGRGAKNREPFPTMSVSADPSNLVSKNTPVGSPFSSFRNVIESA